MEKFEKFYREDFDTEDEYCAIGRLFETMASEDGYSLLYRFEFWPNSAIINVFNIKNNSGLNKLGYPRDRFIKSLVSVDEPVFISLRRNVLKHIADWIRILLKLYSEQELYFSCENIDTYLIHFPQKKLTFEGTKYNYDFNFKDDEDYKCFRFKVTDEDYNVLETIEKDSFHEIKMDPLSIYFIWEEFMPDLLMMDLT